ncbi:SpoIIE family protein phosphatase [Desulfohalobiaceae bacterium Ax17]|jgi:sigma-B regulation protein RsbU (phosphoserine phosphatase)|uniref:PP2C family protein-serine/threonine phosphatase n=1 Tax=Desulfovulcanus ferrireducens TaxID=2831190 RepID=UPI00207BC071|nr:fused response regulator/phosphatase [Desulfovulcanus ferrireducens]MBT8764193.1 SpoIIE family protein phosphatase [Desulfovulcanus ferrireducens]
MAETIKALIIDDSSFYRRMLVSLLKGRFDFVEAKDGEEAIDKYLSFSPDIILLDLNMPKINGLEVIDYIRNKANNNDVFIIVLTGEESQEVKIKALNLGANDFLTKPFSKEELIARIGVAERQVYLLFRLHKAYERMAQELNMVADLQERLLPRSNFSFPGVDLQSLYIPSGMASGDYFDYFAVKKDVLRFVVADVSGHGARAAYIMAMVRTLFYMTKQHYTSLSESVRLINEHLCQVLGEEPDFITLFACDLDLAQKKIEYVNAGHCPGLVKVDGQKILRLDAYLPVLGFFPLEVEAKKIDFTQSVGVFLFTDGFYEWELSPKNAFGLDRFLRLVENLLRSERFYLEEVKDKLDSIPVLPPVYRDDLTALWVETKSE